MLFSCSHSEPGGGELLARVPHLFLQEVSGHLGGMPGEIRSVYAGVAILEVTVEEGPDRLASLGHSLLSEAARREILPLCAALPGPLSGKLPAASGEYLPAQVRLRVDWPSCPPVSWDGPETSLPSSLAPLRRYLRSLGDEIQLGPPPRPHYLRARLLTAPAAAEARRLGLVRELDEGQRRAAADLVASVRQPDRLVEPRLGNPFFPLFANFRPGRTVAEVALGKDVFQVRSLASRRERPAPEIH